MTFSFVDPNTCGFARTRAYLLSINKIDNQKFDTVASQYEYYLKAFEDAKENFSIPFKNYRDNLKPLKKNFKRFSKDDSISSKQYIRTFHPSQWLQMPPIKQSLHAHVNCKGCMKNFPIEQSKFPILSNVYKRKSSDNTCIESKVTKIPKGDVRKVAHEIYDNINKKFKKQTDVEYIDALTSIKQLGVVKKKSKQQRKKELRTIYRITKEAMEKSLEETCVLRTFGTRQSLSKRKNERLLRTFESKAEAEKRVDENEQRQKSHDHVGPLESYDINEILLIENYEKMLRNNEAMNWSELARISNITTKSQTPPKNGGQIAKKFLRERGYNIDENSKVIRRAKRRGFGGEITLPSEPTEDKVKENLKKLLADGTILPGTLVNSKEMEKVTVKNGEFITSPFTVHARKIPLYDIRKKTLEKLKKYMRVQDKNYYDNITEEKCKEILNFYNTPLPPVYKIEEMQRLIMELETQRNFYMWHDASTVANHSYMLFMFGIIYDHAVFYTDAEWESMHNQNISIQDIVEEPYLYVLDQCASSDEDQLQYSETRVECLKQMKTNLMTDTNLEIRDTLRFFKGDGPAIATETGHQKGGHFFCSICPVKSTRTSEFDHSHYLQTFNIKDMQSHVMKGLIASENSRKSCPTPLSQLSKQDKQEELYSRGIKVSLNKKKDEIEEALKDEMKGMKRVPALLFDNPEQQVEDINLDDYEILQFEPMHDIAHHIENILNELSHHFTGTLKDTYKKALEIAYDKKIEKRCCDHRLALLKVIHIMKKDLQKNIFNILVSLAEIQNIVYKKDRLRTPGQILRFHNMVFLHYVSLREVIGYKPISATYRKFYGKYYHDIIRHSPSQIRIICGYSANTEDEERYFHKVKGITNLTSNMKTFNIISNVFIRVQVEKLCENKKKTGIENNIKKIWQIIEPKESTVFQQDIIAKYPREWQAHLHSISDYLLLGEGKWWDINEDQNIVFYDKDNEIIKEPQIYHYRHWKIKDMEEKLESDWREIISQRIKIPANKVLVEDQNGVKNISIASSHATGQKIQETEEKSEDQEKKICLKFNEREIDLEAAAEKDIELQDISTGINENSCSSSNVSITLNSSGLLQIQVSAKRQVTPHFF